MYNHPYWIFGGQLTGLICSHFSVFTYKDKKTIQELVWITLNQARFTRFISKSKMISLDFNFWFLMTLLEWTFRVQISCSHNYFPTWKTDPIIFSLKLFFIKKIKVVWAVMHKPSYWNKLLIFWHNFWARPDFEHMFRKNENVAKFRCSKILDFATMALKM